MGTEIRLGQTQRNETINGIASISGLKSKRSHSCAAPQCNSVHCSILVTYFQPQLCLIYSSTANLIPNS